MAADIRVKSFGVGREYGAGNTSRRQASEKRRLISAGESKAMSFPSQRMQTLSPNISASSMFYVDIRIVYSFLRLMRASQTLFLEVGSRLAVGSSIIINFASPINAIAIDISLLFPALSQSTRSSRKSVTQNRSDSSSIIVFHLLFSMFLRMHVNYRCSLKVRESKRKSCYQQSLICSLATDLDD